MKVKLPSCEYDTQTQLGKHRKRQNNFRLNSCFLAENNMSSALTIKTANSQLYYQISNSMTHAKGTLYTMVNSSTAVLAKDAFNDLQVLETKIDRHEEDLDKLYNTL